MSEKYHAKVSENHIAVPPGTTIEEQLEDCNMTREEFARQMEVSKSFVDDLIEGNVLLTDNVAVRLEKILGVAAYFWLNLEKLYRAELVLVETENKRNKNHRHLTSSNWNTAPVAGHV